LNFDHLFLFLQLDLLKTTTTKKKKSKFNIRHEQINDTPEALENKQTNP
jgi:hypothetical protein